LTNLVSENSLSENRNILKRIIDTTLLEAVFDIPYLFLGGAGIAIAPWRIFYLIYVQFTYQVKRIPINGAQDHEMDFQGRYHIASIAWKAIRYDYPCLLRQIVIILAISRIPI